MDLLTSIKNLLNKLIYVFQLSYLLNKRIYLF